MTDKTKGLVVLTFIIGLSGLIVGGYALVQITFGGTVQEPPEVYVLPKARVFLGSAYALASGMPYKLLNFTDTSFDSHDAFNLPSDAYIVPETGFYHIIAQYSIDAYDQDFFIIQITRNGVIVSSCSYTASLNTNTFGVSITDVINANEGEAISIRAYIYNGPNNPRFLFAGEAYTFFSIVKIA